MKKAFTLIELLIVVAIIAILAAIAVPNFLEAQVRSKVARVRSDIRSYATALEAYYIDNNAYPPSGSSGSGNAAGPIPNIPRNPTGAGNVNNHLPAVTGPAALAAIPSFAARGTTFVYQLTTPIGYVTSLFPDPFMDKRGATYAYWANNQGWICWSPGPNADQSDSTELGNSFAVETVYDITVAQPSTLLVSGGNSVLTGTRAYTYDPTNGTISPGDVWRTKQ